MSNILWLHRKDSVMLIDFTQTINDLDDNPIVIDGKPLTLGSACVVALSNSYMDEQNLSGDKKIARFMLAVKIHRKDLPVEMTIDELSEIKKVLDKQFGTVVYARASMMLEGKK